MPLFAETDIYEMDIPGHGPVMCDPMTLRRNLLLTTSGRCWEYADTARKIENSLAICPSEDQSEKAIATRAELSLRLAEVEGQLVDAGYRVFNLEPVNSEGDGVSETAVLRLIHDYLTWVTEKKESAGK